MVAWLALCDLTIHTIDDPTLLADTVVAFHWHAGFMVEYSKSYDWSGLLRYHFSVAATRSKHGFAPAAWYRQKDNLVFDAVVRAAPARAITSTSARAAPSVPRPQPLQPPPASNSGQYCQNYARGRCTGKCPFDRLHLCRLCRAPHTQKDCPASQKGSMGISV